MAIIDAAERTDRRIDAAFRQAGQILFGLHVAQVFGVERFLPTCSRCWQASAGATDTTASGGSPGGPTR